MNKPINTETTPESSIFCRESVLVERGLMNKTLISGVINELVEKRIRSESTLAKFCDSTKLWPDDVVTKAVRCTKYSSTLDTDLENSCATWLWDYIKNSTKTDNFAPIQMRDNYCVPSYRQFLDNEISDCVVRSLKKLPNTAMVTIPRLPISINRNSYIIHPLDFELHRVNGEANRAVSQPYFVSVSVHDN